MFISRWDGYIMLSIKGFSPKEQPKEQSIKSEKPVGSRSAPVSPSLLGSRDLEIPILLGSQSLEEYFSKEFRRKDATEQRKAAEKQRAAKEQQQSAKNHQEENAPCLEKLATFLVGRPEGIEGKTKSLEIYPMQNLDDPAFIFDYELPEKVACKSIHFAFDLLADSPKAEPVINGAFHLAKASLPPRRFTSLPNK